MNATLSPFLQHGSALLLFSLGIFLVATLAILAARAAERSALNARARVVAPFLVGAYLAVWLGVAIALLHGSSKALGQDALRLIMLVAGVGPMLVAMGLLLSSKTIRNLTAAMPPSWLIRVQTYRMAGLLFLAFLSSGLAAGFAIPAAVGDFLTGLFALPVASAVGRGRPNAIAWARAWNFFGILDLIVAPTTAFLTHARILGHYPLWLIPLFIGPPLGITLHVYSLWNLRKTAGANR